MGPIPGDELEGEVTPWPADWLFTEAIENVLLETNPDDPYSVTVWGVEHNGKFYVAAGSSDSSWVEHIQRNNAVVLSIEHKLYAAFAEIVTNMDEIDRVMARYVTKYEIEPDGNFIEDGGILYRLTPRATELAQPST